MGVTNTELKKQLEALAAALGTFKTQYHTDLHGDAHLSNGEKGVIGTIRDIKAYQETYPSLTHVFAKKPGKVIGAALIMFGVLALLWSAGLYGLGIKMLGFPWPIP